MFVAGVLGSVIGVGLVQVAAAAALVLVAGGDGSLGARLKRMLIVTVIGGAFGFFSYVSAEVAWQAALVLGVVSYLTGLGYAFGRGVGAAGYLLLLWTVAVLIGEAHGGDPSVTAAAFALGGLVAMLVVAVAAGWRASVGHSESSATQAEPPELARPPRIGEVVQSGVGMWSLIRAVAVVIAVVIGYQLTGATDPFWVVIVLLIVFLPDSGQTVFKSLQRGIGTLIGALTAAALLSATTSEPVIIAVSMIALFFAIALYSANYLIYAFFLTNSVVLYYHLAVPEVSDAALRLAAAIIGIALAFASMGLLSLWQRQQPQDKESTQRP